jgi:hypothetical protein
MEWATRYQTEQAENPSIAGLSRVDITPAGAWEQIAIFVPRHELAREVKGVIEHNRKKLGQPVEVPILRGRDHDADKGNAPCRRWREAQDLGRKGLPVYSNLCRRDVSECPYFAGCEYIREWRRAYDAPYVILIHSHLGIGWESTGIAQWAGGFGGNARRSFNPADAPIVVCDEAPTASLIERNRIDREAIQAVTEQGLGEHILAGLSVSGGLLDYLREKGITAEQVRLVASGLRGDERKRGRITSPWPRCSIAEGRGVGGVTGPGLPNTGTPG